MNQYVTGSIIRRLRESRGKTQAQLAQELYVSEKTISKWETGKGYPDISMLEHLAHALGISVIELLAGNDVTNRNRGFNMRRVQFYVCPVCGNILTSTGEAVISCCGVTLPALEAEEPDTEHAASIREVDREYFFCMSHSMSKEHYISFAAIVSENGIELHKFYPEGNAECSFEKGLKKTVYYYCNRHGLYKAEVSASERRKEKGAAGSV